jgi:N-acetylglucosamine kinase-like BadF-type ATPase
MFFEMVKGNGSVIFVLENVNVALWGGVLFRMGDLGSG